MDEKTIEEMLEQYPAVDIGALLFADFARHSMELGCHHSLEIWEKNYSKLPSYSKIEGQEYFELMKQKYLQTYHMSMEELNGEHR
jgi:hypothetical protein